MSLQVSSTMPLKVRSPHIVTSVLYHLIKSSFPTYHCKYPLPCHYKLVPHISLQVSSTISLKVRSPHVVTSILFHAIIGSFPICHCEELIEATWQSSDSSSPGCGRQCKSEAGRAPPLFATSCKLICYKNICG